VLAYHVNSYRNFASFEKGLTAFRPKATVFQQANLSGIFIAGDWIFTNYPSALMERAVSTGREAANGILLSDHVRQASLLVTNPRGPGI
jgi:isorenieratene synthase